MKKEKGSLTIEASLTLVIFLFFFMFFLTFAKYSTVQNKVKHCLNQTAISMSARNNQLVKLSKALDKASGMSTQDISEILNTFGAENAFGIELSPYTTLIDTISENKETSWSGDEMKKEIIRFFAYYYIGLPFNESGTYTYDEIKNMLGNAGITDIEITGGNKEITKLESDGTLTLKNPFVNKNELTIIIKYKIKTGMSFGSFFGIGDDIEFTDSVSAKLMR